MSHLHESAEDAAPAQLKFALVARTANVRIFRAEGDELVQLDQAQGDLFAGGGANVTFPLAESSAIGRALLELTDAEGAGSAAEPPSRHAAGAGDEGGPRAAPAAFSSESVEFKLARGAAEIAAAAAAVERAFVGVLEANVQVERRILAAHLYHLQCGVLASVPAGSAEEVVGKLRLGLKELTDKLARGER